MVNDIFISYSRHDQEFVRRLATDLNAQVAGVWFDQSTIQLGQKWRDEIMDGIRECKSFILVLSPDSIESKYVQEEVNKALELGKTIFPVIYRSSKWTGEFEALVKEVQTLDLRAGSYTDNFQKLVDGLIAAGAGRASGDRPFLRPATKISFGIVLSKVPGWAFAWGLGWSIFWFVVSIAAILYLAAQGELQDDASILIPVLSVSGTVGGLVGGFTGGLFAGLMMMLALRPNAPSISWKHMSPTIRIWGITGSIGTIISWLLLALIFWLSDAESGIIGVAFESLDCGGIMDCVERFLLSIVAIYLLIALVFIFFLVCIWFFTGVIAGWQSVRHIRRLEPGITSRQSRSVSLGWGCGSIIAAFVTYISFWIVVGIIFILLDSMNIFPTAFTQ